MVIAPRAREASVQISLQFDRSRTVDSAAQRSMQRPASCRWQKVVLGVWLYTQCTAVSTLDGSIKVPVQNTRRAAIDTGGLWIMRVTNGGQPTLHIQYRCRAPR
jgi:hypothetical protein